MRSPLFVIFILILVGCKPSENTPIIQKLNSDWEFKSKNGTVWLSASVPGNVFTDLLDNKIIENPFIKNNEEKVQWVSDSTWVYKTTFQLDEKTLSKKHIELNFEGLDTYAKVYLNDSLLLTTNNAFREFLVEIKSIAKVKNVLKIVFESNSIAEVKGKKKLDYELPEGNRIFTRKAQFQYGWDWGPKLNTSGIWKDIYIKAWDVLKIEEIYVKQLHLSDSLATLSANININTIENTNLFVDIILNDTKIATHAIDVEFDKKTYNILFGITNPKLWWPHNLGEPYLYNFKIVVKKGNTILDTYSIKKGLRTIELVTEKDAIGESFYFKVNRLPVYAKGANYIPQNSFQNKVTDQHYEKLLSNVVEANMNMLRVWGGGIYENDIFYDLCDKKGILVWQDFMFACAMYPGDDAFLANVEMEAEQQVKRLRNHASIALWAGNNENSEGWKRWGWQDGKTEVQKKEIWDNYLAVFDTILPNIVKELSETSYWESSPKFGRGNSNYKKEGDAHDWWVWHDGYPFEHFEENVPRFMSEFGFQSFPSFETLNYINQQDSVDIHTSAIKSHQKHVRGFQLIEEYMKRDYPVPTSDEDYVYISQLLQAKGITMGIEAQRRAKPYNMGSLFWQLNDCWPSISWSSIDYFGNWKALHYKAKKSFENVLVTSIVKENMIDTYIVNDNFENKKGELTLKYIDFRGKILWSDTFDVNVEANTSEQYHNLSLGDFQKNNLVFIAEFNGHYSTLYLDKPKNLELLKGEIQKTITKIDHGFSITLKSTVLQKDVFLFTKEKGHFTDNFFDILPNETKTVFFNSDSNSLDDLQIKTLNNLQ